MVNWLQLSSNSGIGTTNITITASTYIGLVDRITSLLVSGVTATSVVAIEQERAGEARGLAFEILSSGTITWSSVSGITIDYVIGNGESRGTLSNGSSLNVSAGDIVSFNATNPRYGSSISTFSHFGGTAYFNIVGNIMSLIYGDNFSGQTSFNNQRYVFSGLFSSANTVDASGLVLPAEIITEGSYNSMFEACHSLVGAPAIPADYMDMFACRCMFRECISLTTAPELPAIVTAMDLNHTYHYGSGCYYQMFYNCTGLTTAPTVLPSIELYDGCYAYMFYGCSSLHSAPELPATTLLGGCYEEMFDGCSSLNYIKCLATNVSDSVNRNNCSWWVHGVNSTGTFVKDSGATWPPATGQTTYSSIPAGWTVVDAT